MNLLRERRIDGLDALDQHGWFQMRHEEAMRCLWTHLRGTFRLMPIIAHSNASDTRCVWPRSGGKIWRIQRLTNGSLSDADRNAPWRRHGVGKRMRAMLEALSWVGRRMSRPAFVKIRWNRDDVGKRDAFRFSEEGNQNDGGKNRALRGDGNDQRSTANAAFAFTLLGTAFDETALQGTEIILRT